MLLTLETFMRNDCKKSTHRIWLSYTLIHQSDSNRAVFGGWDGFSVHKHKQTAGETKQTKQPLTVLKIV